MKKLSNIIRRLGIPLLVTGVAVSARAVVTMTVVDYSTYAEAGFTIDLGGNQILPSDGAIGLYSFDISPGSSPNLPSPFWTMCLSPNGVLDLHTHTYDLETFSAANAGINPTAWSNPAGAPLAGIENGNYLFDTFSGQLLAGGIGGQTATTLREQGAGLALAVYDALYNSTGYGATAGMGTPSSGFYIPGLSGDVLADYNADVAALNSAPSIPWANGYVLRPDPDAYGSGQDMILLANGIPQGGPPVPEPSTIISGLLMLLPFGACTLRVLRKRKSAGPS
jgi:hypothetical protein